MENFPNGKEISAILFQKGKRTISEDILQFPTGFPRIITVPFDSQRAEYHFLSRNVLTVLRLLKRGIITCRCRLVGCDLSTDLALGILKSLRIFQLLSIKRLNALSKSQGAIQLTIL